MGGVLGIALLGAILTTQLKSAFTPALATLGLTQDQMQSIGAAAQHGGLSTEGLTPDKAALVANAFNDAFMHGFRPALVFAGLVLLIAALIANRFIPGRDTVAEHHAAAEAAEGIGPVEAVPTT